MSGKLTIPTEIPKGFVRTAEGGLTAEEAAQRMKDGRGNRSTHEKGKSVGRILFENIFTFFNLLSLLCTYTH